MMSYDVIKIHGDNYAVTQCGSCGVWYVVPQIVHEGHQKDGGYSHCSNGHTWGWRTGTEEIERNALRLERDRLKQDAARFEEDITAATARAAAAEKKLINARRRAVAGVCPCCNRTFTNMQRHMVSKHPNVAPLHLKAGRA